MQYCKEGSKYVQCDLDEVQNVEFTHYVDINTDRKGNPYVIASMHKENFLRRESEKTNSGNQVGTNNKYDCYIKDWGKIEYLVGDDILKKIWRKGTA